MKACVIHGQHKLVVEERETPTPAAHQVAVRLGAGGICGSDLHYYHAGRVGAFVVREPMILGHEVAGEIIATGADVTKVNVGDRVAVNPARPCGVCRECRSGLGNLCSNVYFYGSAARFPHVNGAFAEVFLADEVQCFPISDRLSYAKAACAEPLAVALHGAKRAGDLLGKRVLITGAGPIGLLTLMVVRFAGASEVVITDRMEEPLATARTLGATRTLNTATLDPAGDQVSALTGAFDVAIEAAGALPALTQCMVSVRPGGRVVQLGSLPTKSDDSLRMNLLVTREIELLGSFRFFQEYGTAVSMLETGQLDPEPLLSAQISLAEAESAFALASDRKRALKVSLIP
jgi:L-idonate 5-dehydrogenase